ncbi:hypothetical protein Caci_2878 [Catenulispora acidiphila DSM 44928]|uniref:Uncharacterized protein n=1 Tax=Catenulispora acidiphila (strain DSM 44928 / JCM 14897 / NBRC 102108 / NRRL B-24433 / ID139908) TaxID=479433 RepID=C7Q2P5_CATAD|nr:hypothetical protein [Catenulispora acidiphila]ACU71787.1 hypothetical protein Caci_2878 [Catenulispora acidiphila DSM 44928]
MNMLKRLYAHLYSAELSAAAWIDTRPVGRLIQLSWCHQGLRPWILSGFTVVFIALKRPDMTGLAVTTAVMLPAIAFARIAAKSHYILNEEDRACPYCPPRSDGDGRGGVWLNLGDDIPPAPAPMAEYDDQQIRDWAEDLDGQLAALIADMRRAEAGD